MDYRTASDAYLSDCRRRGLRPATLRYYAMVLDRFAKTTAIGSLDELTLAKVSAFQDASPTLSAGSVRGMLRALHTFATWSVDQGLLAEDPLGRMRLPRADQRVIAVPTDDELFGLMAAANHRMRVVIAAIVGTGLRINDLVSLERADLRPSELIVGQTKNRSGRIVPLDPVLAGLLTLLAPEPPDRDRGPLFTGRTGARLSGDAVRHALADAVELAGIGVRCGPHVLRHWHARDVAAHGVSERLLAARMGWRTHGLIARYAPVGQAELDTDVRRYAPLVRLRDEGLLNGLFPRAALDSLAAQRSKKVGGDVNAGSAPARRWLRHS
jgi:integrase/recombinase XerD